MARRGRKPKATELKVLSGTRADRINARQPSPAASIPSPPTHLDDDARSKWFELAPALSRAGVITELDTDALALYCSLHSRVCKAKEELEREGLTTITDTGCVKVNPTLTVLAATERQMASLMCEFGLTPSSRSRVKAAAATPKDDLASFLNETG